MLQKSLFDVIGDDQGQTVLEPFCHQTNSKSSSSFLISLLSKCLSTRRPQLVSNSCSIIFTFCDFNLNNLRLREIQPLLRCLSSNKIHVILSIDWINTQIENVIGEKN